MQEMLDFAPVGVKRVGAATVAEDKLTRILIIIYSVLGRSYWEVIDRLYTVFIRVLHSF